MKYNLVFVISLLFIGCSTTYKVSDFSSKKEFYDNFNKSMYNKFAKVSLVSDSTFIITGNVKISNDSLIVMIPEQNTVSCLSLEKVGRISSINKENKTLTGLWMGASAGFLIGLPIIANNNTGGNHGTHQSFFPAILVYTASGGIIGAIIGDIFDKTYIYQFNP